MMLPKYSEYKDSGVEWLGAVPNHWEVVRLGALFQEVAEDGFEGLPILSVSIHDGVSDKELNDEEMDRKVTRSDDVSKYVRVEPGDLVYNMMRAWQGGFGTVSVSGMVSPAYVVARPRFGFQTDYVELLMRTPNAVEQMRRLSKGVTDFRLRLYWDEFKSIKVVLPPRDEQAAINAYLSGETAKIDALVAEQEKLIALLAEKRRAVISHAVTKGLDPNAAMKDSGIEWLGEVPAHWEVSLLKRLFASVDYGISDALESEGNIAIIRMGNIIDGKLDLNNLKYADSVPPDLILKESDLLFNRTNSLDLIGKVGRFDGAVDADFSFASYLVRLRVRNGVSSQYLAYALNTPGILGLVRASAFVAIGQCNLNPTRYGELRIAIPGFSEQSAIVTFLDRITSQLDSLTLEAERGIALLKERRAALISAAVTGKIDVRGHLAAEEVAA